MLGAIFIFLLFVSFYYGSPGYIETSLGRDFNPQKDSAWVAYFWVFIGSLFWAAIIVLQIDQVFSLQGEFSFLVSAAVFILIFVCLCSYVIRLRRNK